MKTSENINEIAKAMAAFQSEVKQPEKSAVNPHFKNSYVPLDGIVRSIHAAAPKHGLSYTQIPTVDEQGVSVVTVILHSSGQFIEFPPLTLPMDRKNAQGAGSAITYGKRYSLAAAFGIVSDEDDDGNAASPQQQQRQQRPPQQRQQKPPQPPQAPPKQDGGGISPEQVKELSGVVQEASEKSGIDQAQVFADAAKACGFPGKTSKQLTSQEADKVIKYLRGLIT